MALGQEVLRYVGGTVGPEADGWIVIIEGDSYVKTEGDTMTGPLVVTAPSADTHAINRGYANDTYARHNPPGTILSGIWSTAPAGYSFFGVTVTNAQTLYPEFWAVIPAAWQNGSNADLPPMGDSFLMESATNVGTKAGSNTHTLVSANLPPHVHTMAHTHTINHDHGSVTSGNDSPDHSHGVGTLDIGNDTPDHSHAATGAINQFIGTASGGASSNLGSGGVAINSASGTAGASARHQHPITGSTAGRSVVHTHSVDLPNFTGTSGAASVTDTGDGPGTSTAVDHTPAHLKVRFAIKVAATT